MVDERYKVALLYGNKMTLEDIEEIKKIYVMPRLEMARLYRFAPAGHPWFDSTKPYYKYFERRFKQLGGMTPAVSKEIGW
jgi:hypothetical protein